MNEGQDTVQGSPKK